MPLIEPDARKDLNRGAWPGPITPGELSYCVMRLVVDWYKRQEVKNWSTLADGVKALDAAMDEWKREYVWPYEDKKRAANGAVE